MHRGWCSASPASGGELQRDPVPRLLAIDGPEPFGCERPDGLRLLRGDDAGDDQGRAGSEVRRELVGELLQDRRDDVRKDEVVRTVQVGRAADAWLDRHGVLLDVRLRLFHGYRVDVEGQDLARVPLRARDREDGWVVPDLR